jgi:hypothetical protein
MLNIGTGGSKYVTFWSVEDKGKYSEVKMSSSTKNKDGEYENSNWFARFVGKAHNTVGQLAEKDKIEITQGGIKKYYDKENKKEYYNVVVFDFEVMGEGGGVNPKANQDDFVEVDDSSDVPF